MPHYELYVPVPAAKLPANSSGHSVLCDFCVQARALAALSPNSKGVGDAIKIVVGTLSLGNMSLMAEGVAALCALVSSEPSHAGHILSLGAVELLVAIACAPGSPARSLAAEAIALVGASSDPRRQAVAEVLRKANSLPALVALVAEGPDSSAALWAARLIGMVAHIAPNEACDANAIKPLFGLLCSGSHDMADVAAESLTTILRWANSRSVRSEQLMYITQFAAAIRESAQPPIGSFGELMGQLQHLAVLQIEAAEESASVQQLEEAIEFGRWCRVSSDVFGAARARRKDREQAAEKQRQVEARRLELGLHSGAAQKAAIKEKSRRRSSAAAEPSRARARKAADGLPLTSSTTLFSESKGEAAAREMGAAARSHAPAAALMPAAPDAALPPPPAVAPSGWAGLRRMSATAEVAKALDTRGLPREEVGFAAALRRSVDKGRSWFGGLTGAFTASMQNLTESFTRGRPAASDSEAEQGGAAAGWVARNPRDRGNAGGSHVLTETMAGAPTQV